MALTEAKYKANNKYLKKAYENILIHIRRDSELNGDAIRAHAAAQGESLNGFIKRAIAEAVERDISKQ